MQSRAGWMEGMVHTYNPKAMDTEEEDAVKIKRIKKHDEDSFDEKEEASCMVVDRISELPEFIIHHILSFLESLREVTKTSVLSKRWYHHIWASFPVLNFLENHFFHGSFIYPGELKALRLKFVNFVDKSLLRYQINQFRISKFGLCITLDDSHVVSLVEKWIRLVVSQNQVEELDLQLRTSYDTDGIISFNLPQSLFFESKSLKGLKLDGCSIESLCCRDQIAFVSLKSLSLQQVCFHDEQVINQIISSCPLLGEIILRHCDGLKKLDLYGLHKLRSVDVATGRTELGLIDIEALSLHSFSFNNDIRHYMPRIEMGACKNLKALYLLNIDTDDFPFHDFIARFPLLEELVLASCNMIERVTISSTCLKRFCLIGCESLSQVEIEGPNLLSFQYDGDVLINGMSATNTCGVWEATLGFTRLGHVDTTWFLMLRKFLFISKRFTVVNAFISFEESQVDLHELRNTSTPASFGIEHLKLRVMDLSSNYPAVLDGLLWSCRPCMVTLTVSYDLTNYQYRTDFIKYLYEKLSHTGHACCNDRTGYANNVEIEISERGSSKGKPTDLSVLLDILQTIVGKEVQFKTTHLETIG